LNGARLELSRSWILAAVILALHGAAAASLVAVVPGWAGAALGAAFTLLGLAAAWARALHGSSASVRALEIGDALVVELKDGRRLAAELGASRHVSRFMVTLPVSRPVRRTILVTRDMLGEEEFRRLRLWALWQKLPVAGKQLAA
jgi:hypothetical protein